MNISEYEDAVKKEYGVWVAKAAIFVGGARAFNPGHPVPTSHVEANPDWIEEGLVGKPGDEPVTAPAAPPAPQGADIPLSN